MENYIDVYYDDTPHTFLEDMAYINGRTFVEWFTEVSSMEKINSLPVKRTCRVSCNMQIPHFFKKPDVKEAVAIELRHMGKTDEEIKDFFKKHKLVKEKIKTLNNKDTAIYSYENKRFLKTKLQDSVSSSLS